VFVLFLYTGTGSLSVFHNIQLLRITYYYTQICVGLCIYVFTTFFATDSEQRCSINISLAGNAVHESDFVEINCSVDYRGSWMPVINCIHEVPGQFNSSSSTSQLVVKETSPTRRVSYIRVMSAADIGDLAVIRCDTTFVYREWSRGSGLQAIDRLPDTPRYHHTWRSSPIRVFNTTGNTRSIRVSLSNARHDS